MPFITHPGRRIEALARFSPGGHYRSRTGSRLRQWDYPAATVHMHGICFQVQEPRDQILALIADAESGGAAVTDEMVDAARDEMARQTLCSMTSHCRTISGPILRTKTSSVHYGRQDGPDRRPEGAPADRTSPASSGIGPRPARSRPRRRAPAPVLRAQPHRRRCDRQDHPGPPPHPVRPAPGAARRRHATMDDLAYLRALQEDRGRPDDETGRWGDVAARCDDVIRRWTMRCRPRWRLGGGRQRGKEIPALALVRFRA